MIKTETKLFSSELMSFQAVVMGTLCVYVGLLVIIISITRRMCRKAAALTMNWTQGTAHSVWWIKNPGPCSNHHSLQQKPAKEIHSKVKGCRCNQTSAVLLASDLRMEHVEHQPTWMQKSTLVHFSSQNPLPQKHYQAEKNWWQHFVGKVENWDLHWIPYNKLV